jgi:hypothetical protein
MTRMPAHRVALFAWAAGLVFGCGPACGGDSRELRDEVRELREQNIALQTQLARQQAMIDALSRKVGDLQEVQSKTSSNGRPTDPSPEDALAAPSTANGFGRLHLSGEGGVGFFKTGSEGAFPNSEFRLDEARLFLEAPVYGNVFFYGELDLATREEPDVEARLGEIYVDFENVSQLWNADHQLNVRAGRMYIPFGEEYQTRFAIDNPFISHSLSDLWGVDEGLELYGRSGKFSYVAAVQNGGIPDTRDFTSDKSLAGRIGFEASRHVHLSVSAMRTGEVDAGQDQLSALWFGNGFFRSIGSPATTRFQAELVEGDVQVRLPRGHLSAFGGYAHYHDNDPIAHNGRDLYFYSVEGVHDIFGKLYGAARFSQILCPGGYPLAGNGDFDEYYFGSLSTQLWRLSLDLGYRWSENLLFKAEYSFERGHTTQGDSRNDEDLFALEAAFRF